MMELKIQRPPKVTHPMSQAALVVAALGMALLIHLLATGFGRGSNLAGDRLIVRQCWGAIDRIGLEHHGRQALVDGCLRMERGFERTHGSKL